jgi:hypothetical protein
LIGNKYGAPSFSMPSRRGNWPLAAYELEQLISSLKEAERYYPKPHTRQDRCG